MIYLRYILLVLASIPLLPFMYLQGKRVRKEVPSLSAAKKPKGNNWSSSTSDKKVNLLILGESTMAGIGVQDHKQGFAGHLAKTISTRLKHEVNWSVVAESGYTARQVLLNLVPQIKMSPLDLIVIGLGGNDSFQLNTPWQWKQDIGDLIIALQNKYPGVPIAFTNMPPIHDFPAFTKLLQFTLGSLVKIHGQTLSRMVGYFDQVYFQSEVITLKKWATQLGKPNDPKLFFSDGVHPSALTYEIWAKDFCEYLIVNKVLS